jgi:hypothetical protein
MDELKRLLSKGHHADWRIKPGDSEDYPKNSKIAWFEFIQANEKAGGKTMEFNSVGFSGQVMGCARQQPLPSMLIRIPLALRQPRGGS